MDEGLAGKLFQRILGLGLDPLPTGGDCNSVTIQNLKKKRLNIKRLKCLDILEYRIFYSFKKSGTVCVYCVVHRNDDTYNEESWHYQIVKLLYTKWGDCQ